MKNRPIDSRTVATDVAYDRCHDCGSEMLPDAFQTHPALPDFSGHPAGDVVGGKVWVRCTHGFRGGWYPA